MAPAERRYDPTIGEWRTIVTPEPDDPTDPSDPTDPADRAGGGPTGAEDCPHCRVFDPGPVDGLPLKGYRFAVLRDQVEAPPSAVIATDLQRVTPAMRLAETVLYSNRHDERLATLPVPHLARLVDVWADRYATLGEREDVGYVFVAEHGTGADLDTHPREEIRAYPDIPPVPMRELLAAQRHREAHGTCVFCDVVAEETGLGTRVVAENVRFLAFVPFAARFPDEVHVASKRHATSLLDLTDPERRAFAELLHAVLTGYERVTGPAEYHLSMHQAPTNDARWLPVSHFHVELTAPRLALAAMAAQLGTGAFVNPMPPERTAARLRAAISEG